MARTISAGGITAVNSAHVRPAMFCSLDFDSGTLYVHDGLGTHTWGGHDWLGLGDFGGVDLIEEGEQATPYGVRLRLSGLDATTATEALTGDYHLRAVELYVGFLDAANALVDDPDLVWSGQMDTIDVVTGTENMILVTCESYLAKLERSCGKLFTDAEQRKAYSADTFFKYLPQMQDLRLIWGETRAGQVGSVFNQSGSVSTFLAGTPF